MQDLIKKIHWLGHATFRIDAAKIIYFDPYQLKDGPKADYIFISHDHFDHCSPQDIDKIKQKGTIIITEKDSAKKLKGNIKILKVGDTLDLKDLKVTAVPAYNLDKPFHPQKKGWLGFIVAIQGVRLYHSGDTDFIPEMKTFQADITFLPVSGTYVMDASEAAAAARAIRPRIAIPMHYGSVVGSAKDATEFKDKLDGEIEVRILG